MVGTSSAANATLYDNLAFNFLRDIAPVGGISRTYYVMLVHPSVQAKTGAELLALAKANPSKLNMASPGSGTGAHMASELFKIMTGISMVHVPYRGSGPMLAGLLGGQVQFAFDTIFSSIEHIRSGGLRALGVSTATRSELLPDIPTVAEFVPGYEASTWFGVGAPKNTSPAIIDKLNTAINAGLADPKMRARIADLGGQYQQARPPISGKLIVDETEKWASHTAANIKPGDPAYRSILPDLGITAHLFDPVPAHWCSLALRDHPRGGPAGRESRAELAGAARMTSPNAPGTSEQAAGGCKRGGRRPCDGGEARDAVAMREEVCRRRKWLRLA
jgi:tripartite-type tricarboxylate transporter receptor subunit TctC